MVDNLLTLCILEMAVLMLSCKLLQIRAARKYSDLRQNNDEMGLDWKSSKQ